MALIQIDHLSRYYGGQRAFEAENVSLPSGAIGLLGPNGAGKTTLIKMLLGLLSPSSGTACVLGLDVRRRGVELRKRLGYMSEDDTIVPGLTALGFVALAGELCHMPRREALRRAHEVLNYVGLAEERYRAIEELSTGMKQRAKLAQALVHDPELLILDEPTAGLDPGGRRAMLTLISRLHRQSGKSFVLSTHILDDVDRVCDSALILEKGGVLACGPTDSLKLSRGNVYRLRLRGDPDPWLARLEASGAQVADVDTAAVGTRVVHVELPLGFESIRLFELLLEVNGLLAERGEMAENGAGGRTSAVVLEELVRPKEKLDDVFRRLIEVQE